MSNSSTTEFIEAAYARLRENLAAKDIGDEHLRSAALHALDRARAQVELDPQASVQEVVQEEVVQEIDRLHTESLKRESDSTTP